MLTEKLSSCMDGELANAEAQAVLRMALREPGHREALQMSFLIGDVLRAEPEVSAGFCSSVMRAIESEPAILAPRAPQAAEPAAPTRAAQWLGLAASAAGVAVVAWLGFGSGEPQRQTLATANTTITVPEVSSLLARTERDDNDAYVMAHYASASGSPVRGVPAFVRTVSAERMDLAR
jgi:negative regulator of sigma E activity